MANEFLADAVAFFHLFWVVFIVTGFGWTVAAFFVHRKFLDIFWLRTVHLAGVLLAVLLSKTGLYCPLTAVEIYLRKFTSSEYSGGFLAHNLERWLNPGATSTVIEIGTLVVFLGTLAAYLFRPPKRAASHGKWNFGKEQTTV